MLCIGCMVFFSFFFFGKCSDLGGMVWYGMVCEALVCMTVVVVVVGWHTRVQLTEEKKRGKSVVTLFCSLR